jgi:CheY-like chemotaxis protein
MYSGNPSQPRAAKESDRMKILAVDDDPISLELLEVLVGQIGNHHITCVDSAASALLEIGTSQFAKFDCILLDVQMPGMNGIELCELLRSTPVYSDTPILMVTKMGEKSFIDQAFKAGATDYLNKPFEISELRGRLNILSRVAEAKRNNTGKLFCADKTGHGKDMPANFGLHSPIQISDIDGIIEYSALENYVAQLSRNSLFGSCSHSRFWASRKSSTLYPNSNSNARLKMLPRRFR